MRTYKEQAFDHVTGLDGISDGQVAEHLTLYAGYVKQVNALNAELAELRGTGKVSGKNPEFAELTRRLGFEYNGMILHEYYFQNLRRAADPRPHAHSGLARAIDEAFGSVADWQRAFQAIGEMRGIGWVILFQDPATDRLSNHWIELHQEGVPAAFKPLLTEKGKYIEAFFRNIDWRVVGRRLDEEAA